MCDLQNGIQSLYDMEANIYLMKNTLIDLDKKISMLAIEKRYNKPEKGTTWVDFGGYIAKSASVCFLIAFIVSIINMFIQFEKNGGGILSGISSLGSSLVFAFWCSLILLIIGLVIGCIIGICKKIEENDNENKKYKSEYNKYIENLNNDFERVTLEKSEKRILIFKRKMLYDKIKESEVLLNDMYLKSGIDKNYWGLIPIGYMNEFIRLGISNHFDGTDGLYYLVRQEIRSDRLQFTVDEINDKLDTIIDNQNRLFDELREIRNQGNRIIKETIRSAEIASKNNVALKNIECNTALDAYYTQQLNSELRYRNNMDIIFNKWT